MLECRNLNKTYKDGNNILKNINVVFPDKGFIFIYGESGSGKTTLINILERIDKNFDGEVLYNGKSIKKIRNYHLLINVIFQETNFISNLTVKECIVLYLNIKNKRNIYKTIIKNLEQEFYKDILKRKIKELSGGEKQRLIIYLTINIDYKIIFCDEVTGSVDEENEKKILDLLKKYSLKSLVIAISHNEYLYKNIADRTYFIKNGELFNIS